MSDLPTPTARRFYRLTPAGLSSLRASASLHRPWLASTGPRSLRGKAAAQMNALRHGERSADVRRAMAEIRKTLRDFHASR